jgi:hypothetical protein
MTRGNNEFRLRAVLPYYRYQYFSDCEAELEEIHASLCGEMPADRSCAVLLHDIGDIENRINCQTSIPKQ